MSGLLGLYMSSSLVVVLFMGSMGCLGGRRRSDLLRRCLFCVDEIVIIVVAARVGLGARDNASCRRCLAVGADL